MRILLTNDDGIQSPGLKALTAALQDHHDVWVIAPDGERSGMSHSLSLRDPIRVERLGPQQFAVGGSPADCVIVGITGLMEGSPPDVVLSGINLGPNLGTDVTFSGTAAAARQASYMGYPGLALSMYTHTPPFELAPAARFLAANIVALTDLWEESLFININFPNLPSYPAGYAITTPARRLYVDDLHHFDAPAGVRYYFMSGVPRECSLADGSDWFAVEQGQVSISPISVNPINHDAIDHFHQVTLQSGQEGNQ
ncbi:5'/3'-nucleotidase SurE [Spirochaeta africana]|uniref:5'-nucleotidase SurE n=1 Tax=Spirochaeta africana (strain ATCC 700263 / DSM 8902 / Z-7692) TaxID=889378 RepID=H9UKE1_SPIAZ|nr:5'/3'-nucleotidase SurE [Spirochaeta africana]AFG37984.1 5'/3'-nucleotidase SurE [Spirochaeta africana DSM 8902]